MIDSSSLFAIPPMPVGQLMVQLARSIRKFCGVDVASLILVNIMLASNFVATQRIPLDS